MTPERLQRSRKKGYRMPEGAIYVGRPTKWGNLFVPILETGTGIWRVTAHTKADLVLFAGHEHSTRDDAIADVVEMYRMRMVRHSDDEDIPMSELLSDLTGRDLVCWCPLDQPCHADVLLELANGDADV